MEPYCDPGNRKSGECQYEERTGELPASDKAGVRESYHPGSCLPFLPVLQS